MNKYQVSADKMYRLRLKLKNQLKRTDESEVEKREALIRRIELLTIIRQEMRVLINL